MLLLARMPSYIRNRCCDRSALRCFDEDEDDEDEDEDEDDNDGGGGGSEEESSRSRASPTQ